MNLMDLAAVKRLINEGEQKKKEKSLSRLTAEIDDKQEAIDNLKNRQNSARIELEKIEKGRAEADFDLTRLCELSKFIDDNDEVEKARKGLLEHMAENEMRLKSQRECLKELNTDISIKIADVIQLRDKLSALADPSYTPKYPRNLNVEVLMEDCNQVTGQAYRDIMILQSEIPKRFTLPDGTQDTAGILLKVKIVSAILRREQDRLINEKKINSADEVVLRECFKKMGILAKYHCQAWIKPLSPNWTTNWGRYITEHVGLFNGHMHRRNMAEQHAEDKANGKTKAPAPAPAPERPVQVEDLLITEMIENGAIEKTKGKRVLIYGGYERKETAEWLMNAMGFASLKWYQYSKARAHDNKRAMEAMANSDEDGKSKIDLLILFTVCGHGEEKPIMEMARKRKIPTIRTDSIAKNILCYKITYEVARVKLSDNPKMMIKEE